MGRITLRLFVFAFGMALVGVYVAGCAPIPSASPQASSLRPIAVEAVQVEIGVGSPIPVDVFVSGTWPDLCAQLAEMTQRIADSKIEIETPGNPGQAGLPAGLPRSCRSGSRSRSTSWNCRTPDTAWMSMA